MAKNYKQGLFTPRNPQKYKGNPHNITYRSSWELKLMTYFDRHPDVLVWSSEEFPIPYRHPMEGTVRRYFPDFWMKRRKKDGTIDTMVIEIKPEEEMKPPKVMTGKRAQSKGYLYKIATYATNQAKWEAAKAFCAQRGWIFKVMNKKDLGIK
jgi:hypothetical protein